MSNQRRSVASSSTITAAVKSPASLSSPLVAPTQPSSSRRKSSLSSKGFFIDYSYTRRRSSVAANQHRESNHNHHSSSPATITSAPFLQHQRRPSHLSSAGRSSASVQQQQQQQPHSSQMRNDNNNINNGAHQEQQQQRGRSFCAGQIEQPTSSAPTGRRPSGLGSATNKSRQQATSSPGGANRSSGSFSLQRHSFAARPSMILLSPTTNAAQTGDKLGVAAAALAGSRKTSIFDPAGHSLASATNASMQRRKSTMVAACSSAPGDSSSTAMMMSVARSMAQRSSRGGACARASKSDLVAQVPVIGCSPTSICASLAALDETRRYEKLLSKLKRHQRRKTKRQLAEMAMLYGDDDEGDDDDDDDYDDDDDDSDDDEDDDDEDNVSEYDGTCEAARSSSNDNNNNERDINDERIRRRKSRPAGKTSTGSVSGADDSDLSEASCSGDCCHSGSPNADAENSAAALRRRTRRQHSRHKRKRRRRQHKHHNNSGTSKPLATSLRRASVRAIKDAATLLSPIANKRARRRLAHKWRHGNGSLLADGLSISSTLSFASSQTSLPSMNRFDELCDEELDDELNFERSQRLSFADDTMVFYNDGCRPRLSQQLQQQIQQTHPPNRSAGTKKSLVHRAMSKIVSSLSTTARQQSGSNNKQQQYPPQPQVRIQAYDETSVIQDDNDDGGGCAADSNSNNNNVNGTGSESFELAELHNRQARLSTVSQLSSSARRRSTQWQLSKTNRSISVGAELNYWHYYYYLRDNSFDAVDDLPISSGGHMNEIERRTRLYINYSLARLEILNSKGNPIDKMAERVAAATRASTQNLMSGELSSVQASGTCWSSVSGCNQQQSPLLQQQHQAVSANYNGQSTDVSIDLSTSSSRASSSSTSRNSSSLSSRASTASSTPTKSSLSSSPTCRSRASVISGCNERHNRRDGRCNKQHQQTHLPHLVRSYESLTRLGASSDRSQAGASGEVRRLESAEFAADSSTHRYASTYLCASPGNSTSRPGSCSQAACQCGECRWMQQQCDSICQATGTAAHLYPEGCASALASGRARSHRRKPEDICTGDDKHRSGRGRRESGGGGARNSPGSQGPRRKYQGNGSTSNEQVAALGSSAEIGASAAGDASVHDNDSKDDDEELDDFERFNRSHRGYSLTHKALSGTNISIGATASDANAATLFTGSVFSNATTDLRPGSGSARGSVAASVADQTAPRTQALPGRRSARSQSFRQSVRPVQSAAPACNLGPQSERANPPGPQQHHRSGPQHRAAHMQTGRAQHQCQARAEVFAQVENNKHLYYQRLAGDSGAQMGLGDDGVSSGQVLRDRRCSRTFLSWDTLVGATMDYLEVACSPVFDSSANGFSAAAAATEDNCGGSSDYGASSRLMICEATRQPQPQQPSECYVDGDLRRASRATLSSSSMSIVQPRQSQTLQQYEGEGAANQHTSGAQRRPRPRDNGAGATSGSDSALAADQVAAPMTTDSAKVMGRLSSGCLNTYALTPASRLAGGNAASNASNPHEDNDPDNSHPNSAAEQLSCSHHADSNSNNNNNNNNNSNNCDERLQMSNQIVGPNNSSATTVATATMTQTSSAGSAKCARIDNTKQQQQQTTLQITPPRSSMPPSASAPTTAHLSGGSGGSIGNLANDIDYASTTSTSTDNSNSNPSAPSCSQQTLNCLNQQQVIMAQSRQQLQSRPSDSCGAIASDCATESCYCHYCNLNNAGKHRRSFGDGQNDNASKGQSNAASNKLMSDVLEGSATANSTQSVANESGAMTENQMLRQQQLYPSNQLKVPLRQRHSPSSSSSPNVHNVVGGSMHLQQTLNPSLTHQQQTNSLTAPESGCNFAQRRSMDAMMMSGTWQVCLDEASMARQRARALQQQPTGKTDLHRPSAAMSPGFGQVVDPSDTTTMRFASDQFNRTRRSASALFRPQTNELQQQQDCAPVDSNINNNNNNNTDIAQQPLRFETTTICGADNNNNNNNWIQGPSQSSLNSSVTITYPMAPDDTNTCAAPINSIARLPSEADIFRGVANHDESSRQQTRPQVNNNRYNDLALTAATAAAPASTMAATVAIGSVPTTWRAGGGREATTSTTTTSKYAATLFGQRPICADEQMMWRSRAHSTGTRNFGSRALSAAASNAVLLLVGTSSGSGYPTELGDTGEQYSPETRQACSNISDLNQIRTAGSNYEIGTSVCSVATGVETSVSNQRLPAEQQQQQRQQSEESNLSETSRHSSLQGAPNPPLASGVHNKPIVGQSGAAKSQRQSNWSSSSPPPPPRSQSPRLVLSDVDSPDIKSRTPQGRMNPSNGTRDKAGTSGTPLDLGSGELDKTTATYSSAIRADLSATRCHTKDSNCTNNIVEQHALELLRKSSFTCMVIGARQTGKRTIVKCFVKLLNEFKLAAEEYRKEKMLNKLVGFSERLQELQQQRQESLEDHQQQQERAGQRSRLNSWLGSNTVNKLLNLPIPAHKQRLHSVSGLNPARDLSPETQPRRNTAIDTRFRSSFQAQTTSLEDQTIGSANETSNDSRRFLDVERANRLTSCTNKSDSNVNYTTTSRNTNDSNQLRVPTPSSRSNLRKGSDFSSLRGSVFLNEPTEDSTTTVGGCAADDSTTTSTNRLTGESRSRLLSTGSISRAKRQSILTMSKRKRRAKLSLKEMNRRRCRVIFKTRRIISDNFSRILCPEEESEETDLYAQRTLPDAFLVVYSINDRDSFAYAKELVSHIRATKRNWPLPIVLVANKIDLERARMVKCEEGRSLAREFMCKFIETSCTVGYNLDHLLVGLRTQLVLKHHAILNPLLRHCKSASKSRHRQLTYTNPSKGSDRNNQSNTGSSSYQGGWYKATEQQGQNKPKSSGNNILMWLYRRYVMDNCEQNYDCDNFSKL